RLDPRGDFLAVQILHPPVGIVDPGPVVVVHNGALRRRRIGQCRFRRIGRCAAGRHEKKDATRNRQTHGKVLPLCGIVPRRMYPCAVLARLSDRWSAGPWSFVLGPWSVLWSK